MRYVVKKESGSRFARVYDTKTNSVVQSFDVLRPYGWEKAEMLRDYMNAMEIVK